MRIPTAVVATLLSAVTVTLAFPPAQLRLLIWVALVPFLVALRGVRFRTAVALGALWGMVGAYGVTDWLPHTVSTYYLQPLWVGIGLFSVAAFTMGAVYYALFAAFYRWAGRRSLAALVVWSGAAWVAAELARARVLSGNPWGLLGYAQAGVESSGPFAWLGHVPITLLQVADLGGVYAVSFVIVCVNVALAEIWLWGRGVVRARRAVEAAALATVLLGASLSYGRLRIDAGVPEIAPPVPVAIAQGNLDLGSQWDESFYGRNLDVYLRLTRQAVEAGRPRIVFWPENAMTFFVDKEPIYRAYMAAVTAPADVELLAGAPSYVEASAPLYFNAAFVMAPDGEIEARYEKEHLLPFAEYFPLRSVAYLRRSFGRVREFTPGRQTAPMPTRAGPAGIAICNEAMFGRVVRERVRAGATYLVNLSNDTWVDDVEFALHQFNLVSLRAVEQRRYLVRASTSGPSGVVDPFGRVRAVSEPFSQAFLLGSIAPIEELSPYGRLGDAFAAACVLAVLARLAAAALRRRRRG